MNKFWAPGILLLKLLLSPCEHLWCRGHNGGNRSRPLGDRGRNREYGNRGRCLGNWGTPKGLSAPGPLQHPISIQRGTCAHVAFLATATRTQPGLLNLHNSLKRAALPLGSLKEAIPSEEVAGEREGLLVGSHPKDRIRVLGSPIRVSSVIVHGDFH